MTLSVIRKQQNAKETYKMALSQSSTNHKTKKNYRQIFEQNS